MGFVGDAIDRGQDFISDSFKELTGAKGAEEAAEQQAKYLERAKSEVQEAADEAKSDLIARLSPALTDYAEGIQNAQDQIAAGTTDVMRILEQYTGNADRLLAQGGANAQRAIMGSSATLQGIPTSQFNQMYATAQSAPPAAKAQLMSNLYQATGMPPLDTTNIQTQAAQPFTPPLGGTPAAVGGYGTGFTGAASDIMRGYSTGQEALTYGTQLGRGDIESGTQAAQDQLMATREAGLGAYEPYSQAGRAAVEKEAALSGAYGPEAQQRAIDEYIESPGQKYLREQQEKSLLRNQAAIGGLGGANVRTALQEQAMNIASTQQQQYLENLRSLAGRGQQIAGAESSLIAQTGMAGAGLEAQAGQALAQLAQQYGVSSADLARMSSSELAQLANQTGLSLATLQQGVAQSRAGLQTGLGGALSQARAGATSDIAGLTQQSATNQLTAQQNLGNMLAGITTGTGTTLAELSAQKGSALATGTYLSGQALPNTVGTLTGLGLLGYGMGFFGGK